MFQSPTGGRVETSTALQERLVAHGVQVEAFIDQVVIASQGNFLYLVWLLPAIADGSLWFDTLDGGRELIPNK